MAIDVIIAARIPDGFGEVKFHPCYSLDEVKATLQPMLLQSPVENLAVLSYLATRMNDQVVQGVGLSAPGSDKIEGAVITSPDHSSLYISPMSPTLLKAAVGYLAPMYGQTGLYLDVSTGLETAQPLLTAWQETTQGWGDILGEKMFLIHEQDKALPPSPYDNVIRRATLSDVPAVLSAEMQLPREAIDLLPRKQMDRVNALYAQNMPVCPRYLIESEEKDIPLACFSVSPIGREGALLQSTDLFLNLEMEDEMSERVMRQKVDRLLRGKLPQQFSALAKLLHKDGRWLAVSADQGVVPVADVARDLGFVGQTCQTRMVLGFGTKPTL